MIALPAILSAKDAIAVSDEAAGNWHIHLQGRVQGVGFRPYIYTLATQWQLQGRVQTD